MTNYSTLIVEGTTASARSMTGLGAIPPLASRGIAGNQSFVAVAGSSRGSSSFGSNAPPYWRSVTASTAPKKSPAEILAKIVKANITPGEKGSRPEFAPTS